MATAVGYGYEGLSAGAAIPVGAGQFWDSFTAADNTAVAEAGASTVGLRGCRITNVTVGQGGYLTRTFTPSSSFTMSVEFFLPTPPTAGQQRLFDLGSSSAQYLRLDQNSDNRLLVRNAAASTISAPQMGMATAGTVGDKMRWRIYWAKGATTSTGTLRSELTNLTTSALIVDNQSTALNMGTADADRIRMGYPLSTNAGVLFFDHDQIVVATDPSSISDLAGPGLPVPPFGAPGGLSATPISPTQIDLNWDDTSTATGYDVERDAAVIATGVAVSAFSDTGLSPGTSHDYRVRATKGA